MLSSSHAMQPYFLVTALRKGPSLPSVITVILLLLLLLSLRAEQAGKWILAVRGALTIILYWDSLGWVEHGPWDFVSNPPSVMPSGI